MKKYSIAALAILFLPFTVLADQITIAPMQQPTLFPKPINIFIQSNGPYSFDGTKPIFYSWDSSDPAALVMTKYIILGPTINVTFDNCPNIYIGHFPGLRVQNGTIVRLEYTPSTNMYTFHCTNPY